MAAVSPITLIFNAVDQASPVVKNIISGLKENVGVVGALSLAYNQTQQAIASFAAQGQKAYQLLIGQNVQLQQQLLATQASLVATNKIISQGAEISDPTKAIQALSEPVNQAVAKLRQGSLELVGVTSNDLVPLFQLIAGQSANIGASLDDASKLALDFAAALGTSGIPLFQARQEINSILTAQITSDSQLAKNIGLNNEQINQYKAQGVLVEKLTERLSAFRAGNALAAQTIEGITSNIQEIIDEIGRVAGAPLLQPIVNQLNVLYKFLQDNKDLIQQVASQAVQFFLDIASKLGEAVKAVQPVVETLAQALFTQLSAEAEAAASVITILVDGFVALVKVATPLLQVLANITLLFAQLAKNPIGQIVIQAGLLLSLAVSLAPAIASLTAAFIALTTSTGAVVAAMGGFSGIVATLAAGGLPALTASLLAAVPALGAFGAAATAAIAPLLPIIALGGAIALTLEIKQIGDLKQANEELEEFRQQNETLGDESIKLASKLKFLNDQEKANGKLSEEEAQRRRGLQQVTKGQTEALQAQIQAIKQVRPANEEQRQTQQTQIEQLQRQIDLLNKLSGGVKLQAKDLQQLGNTYEQLSKKVADAQSQFEQGGGGDTARFKSAATDLVKLTNQQIELGQLSQDQAIARLAKVRDDARVEFDVQLQAQDAITKIRQGQVDKRVKATEDEQQKIQALISGEEISQSEGQRRITQVKLEQLRIQLEATKAAIASENALRQQQVNQQVAAIDKQIAEAEGRRQKAEAGGDKGGARIAKEDIARLESQKATAQQSLNIDNDRLTQLKSQQQKFTTEIAQVEGQEQQRVRQERLKDFDEQQAILEAQNAQRLITEEQFNERSLAITKARGAEELKQLAEQRAKLPASDKEGQEAIAAREAAIRKKIAEDTEKFEVSKSQARIAAVDTEQKELAAKLAEGQVSQQEFNQQSLTLTQQRLQTELDEVDRQRAKLKAGDSKRLNELDAQEADIRKRQAEAIAQSQEQQAQLIEQAQKRATDIVSQSEADRLTEITKLEAAQTISKVEAEKLRTDAAGNRVKEELRLEKEKLAQLEALPQFSDPIKEENRQSQIRASRLKTSQLTKSLIDNEIQRREAVFKVVEENLNQEIQKIQNNANAQNQALERQQQLQDFVSKSLDNQIKLLEARKNLISSVAGFYEGELNVLKETTKNQKEQQKLGETAAEIRLNSARAAFEIEKEITKQKIEQRNTELAIRELQLQAEAASASAATLKAKAEQQKIEARPGATTEEKQAAALDVQAAIAKEFELQLKGVLLGQERAIASTEGQQELGRLGREQQLQDDQNRLALANARVDKRQGRTEREQLQRDILGREGVQSLSVFGKGINFNQLQSQISKGILPSSIPQTIQVLPVMPVIQTGETAKQAVGTVNININNEFTGRDAITIKAADNITQRIRSELNDILILANR